MDRNKLWSILYKKGLPVAFINMIKIGHNNNQLCSKINGEYSNLINNNVGVFQGSPLSAYLFIIYADYIMKQYNNSIKKPSTNITKSNTITRSNEYENKWTNLTFKKIHKIDHENIQDYSLTNEINTSFDHLLYADDTAIEYKKLNDINTKIKNIQYKCH